MMLGLAPTPTTLPTQAVPGLALALGWGEMKGLKLLE